MAKVRLAPQGEEGDGRLPLTSATLSAQIPPKSMKNFKRGVWRGFHYPLSSQAEILRYLEHVAARHDLKRDICFNIRVTGAQFDEANGRWNIRTDAGDAVTARFLITAVGTLSDTNLPPFAGLERFRGKWYHTSRFPRGGVDFTAKRVAVVGTGASAVQAIPEIAQQAKQLTVFQRTPNYCLPARNGKVDPERVAARKADYDAIIERTRSSFAGFELARIPKSALEATPEEREREFEHWELARGQLPGAFEFLRLRQAGAQHHQDCSQPAHPYGILWTPLHRFRPLQFISLSGGWTFAGFVGDTARIARVVRDYLLVV